MLGIAILNFVFQYRERDFLCKSLCATCKSKNPKTHSSKLVCFWVFPFSTASGTSYVSPCAPLAKANLLALLSKLKCSHVVFQYRERDLNPHSHHWPKDFKSFVSTDSTIAAWNRVQRYNKKCKYTRKIKKTLIFILFFCF